MTQPTRVLAAGCVALIAACAGGTKTASAPPAAKPAPEAPAAPATVSTSPGDTLPSSMTPAMVKAGRDLFNDGSCAKCHGMGGINGQYGPNLTDNKWVQIAGTYPEIVDIIMRGVPASKQKLPSSNPQFAMRARGGMDYTNDEIQKIAAYVWTASHTAHR